MRRQFVLAALLGLAILTVGTSATLAARGSGNVLYVFNGRMMADAGSNPTIAVDVNGGNKPALRKLVGQSDNANFAVDAHTQYIRWTHGVPTVVPESNLLAGDRVSVRILAERRASLAQIEGTPARRVADSGPSGRFPRQSLWLFQGALDRPVGGGHLTLHISDGNLRALRAMLGQPLDQTFSYDRHTVFVMWRGGVPTAVSPGALHTGDRITVRIRAPHWFSLAQVEQVPANHVGDRQPAG
ncbi:MAG TPA: hypothetical protein VJ829_16910 [Candidatus Binatia bacterium]|jgi:hypothetical protein|nr:hypothetical protein [Candidatus Binatia bacterium]HMD12795.1 hypothetical protein [Marmoricola sp.]